MRSSAGESMDISAIDGVKFRGDTAARRQLGPPVDFVCLFVKEKKKSNTTIVFSSKNGVENIKLELFS